MSGYSNDQYEHHQRHRERREERREARHEPRGYQDDYDDRDNSGSQYRGQRPYDDDAPGRPQSYQSQGRGYAPPSARGASALASQGGLDRGDFASDADIDRMVATGEFDQRRGPGRQEQGREYSGAGGDRRDAYGRYDAPPGSPPDQGYGQRANEYGRYDVPSGPPPGQGRGGRGNEYGRYDAPPGPPLGRGRGGRGNEYGRYDAPSGSPPDQRYGERANENERYDAPSGPPPGQRYGERVNEYERYDAPSGPPPGKGYQSQQSYQQGHGSSGTSTPSYGGGPDRPNQYGPTQTQGRARYDSPQGPSPGQGKGQGNAPAGGFMTSRPSRDDGEEKYGSGYGGSTNNRNDPPRRGEAASYYNQESTSGKGDRYAHLAGLAQEQGDEDPELYRRATQGLQEKIQAQSRPQRRDDDDRDYKAHVDAHKKAYGEDDHGPMDADTIGAAAAMEAFKQTAAGSSNAPAGGFQTGKSSGGRPSKSGRAEKEEEEEEEEETPASGRAGASGGMQDKLMALAMSQAGKLFDKKNAGSSGDKSQDKAQAMQSAAANAMQLFAQYQTKGKLDSGDMSKVMGLAMKML